jgi:alpha-ketoglutarate-dependent taurine dioxygenase
MPIRYHGPRPWVRARREQLSALRFERIGVRPLAATVGAEISGADLGDLDDAAFAEIQHAFLEYKVIFFRDQPISIDEQLAFARRFGPLEEHPFLPAKDGYGQVIRFAKDERTVGVENAWHSDVSWREIPPLGTVLHAIGVPEVGGDTLFADMEAAYASLPDDVREHVDGLTALHDFASSFGLALPKDELAARQREFPPVRHPVVRTHPRTGRRSLYVNGIFTSHVEGMEREASDALLARLCAQAAVPEFQCRFRWRADSVAFWDNRSAQHYAANDYWPEPRVMERATIAGDRPV